MCGIVGVLDGDALTAPQERIEICRRMVTRLRHRGPDDAGVWQSRDKRLTLGHARLAVLDLTSAGAQPMSASDRDDCLVYNGEVYNHSELRPLLTARGVKFHGRSDTETVLHASREWGPIEAAQRYNGMFALAYWESAARRLTLARDRVGIKPLYWTRQGRVFAFASELSALRLIPGLDFDVSANAVEEYLHWKFVPAPRTVFHNVYKVPPGHALTIENEGTPRLHRYWALPSDSAGAPTNIQDAVVELEHLVRAAVQRRLISDVPIGAFLSGGIDSALVVSLMRSLESRVRTFTIGFEDKKYDEADRARLLATHLETDHTQLVITDADAHSALPKLPLLLDEPLADASVLPTALVSSLARNAVTVALTGDGGDELFAGYSYYRQALLAARLLEKIPIRIRKHIGSQLTPSRMNLLAAALRRRSREGLMRAPSLFRARDTADLYAAFRRTPMTDLVCDRPEPSPADWPTSNDHTNILQRLREADFGHYLPDDVLTKVDRASMAVGLEARVPLLDHTVVEFAFRVPSSWHMHSGTQKYLLRSVLGRYVPETLFSTPKRGFNVPLRAWLRGPLRDWTEDLLSADNLRQAGLIDPARGRDVLASFSHGTAECTSLLWAILVLHAWWGASVQKPEQTLQCF